LKHEIGGKAGAVALNGFVEVASGDSIERREVAIQHHALPANQKNSLLDLFWVSQWSFVVHKGGRAGRSGSGRSLKHPDGASLEL